MLLDVSCEGGLRQRGHRLVVVVLVVAVTVTAVAVPMLTPHRGGCRGQQRDGEEEAEDELHAGEEEVRAARDASDGWREGVLSSMMV